MVTPDSLNALCRTIASQRRQRRRFVGRSLDQRCWRRFHRPFRKLASQPAKGEGWTLSRNGSGSPFAATVGLRPLIPILRLNRSNQFLVRPNQSMKRSSVNQSTRGSASRARIGSVVCRNVFTWLISVSLGLCSYVRKMRYEPQ